MERGGSTRVTVASPCHGATAAELSYSDIRLGVALDRYGNGAIEVMGFERVSRARLVFNDGQALDFDIPFSGLDRIDRVAIVWDEPIALEIHALEFGARQGSEGHVHPGNPRSFRDVRRRGGGFVNAYAPVDGVGQSVQVYSYWLRRGGRIGAVDLFIDFTSRRVDRMAETCGQGSFAAPRLTVLRAERGEMGRATQKRLAAAPCDMPSSRLIDGAVDDIIVSYR